MFRRHRSRSGFTLIETLLVIAVIALLASLFLPGITSVLRSINNDEPDKILWDAITLTREQALSGNRQVWLRLDKEKRVLTWTDGALTKTKTWPAGVTLQFLQPTEDNNRGATILIGGRLVETEELAAVRFYPDGTCDRFRAQIRVGDGAAQVIGVDPWTCAQVIGANDKK
jgi:prepilin-type N-terminal cleavage/methylation domain-containing protein